MKPPYPTPEHFRQRRVDPASINHYMCYHCGDVETKLIPYQQHMLQHHEVITQSYQLWSDTMNERYGFEWREETEHDSTDTAGEQESEHEVSPPRSVPKRESKKENEEGSDEDYVYELDQNRKRRDSGAKKSAKSRPRKKKTSEPPSKRAKTSLTPVEDFPMEPFPQTIKIEEVAVGPAIEESSEISDLVNRILSEGKRKESASQDVVEEEEKEDEPEWTNRKPFPSSAAVMKYCRICRKTSDFNFASLFQHYQEFHHAEFVSFSYYGFVDKRCIGKKVLKEKSHCQRCRVRFSSAQDYFQHMVQNHLYESVRCQTDFKDATSADVEAILKFRDRKITCGYNIKFQPFGAAPIKEEVVQNQQYLGHDGSLPGPSNSIPTIAEEPEEEEDERAEESTVIKQEEPS